MFVAGRAFTIMLPPGTQAYRVAIYSTPILLAAGGAASSVEVTIPTDLAPGAHTLVVWADVGDEVIVLGSNLTVQAPLYTGSLPATGSSSTPWTTWGLLLVALGAAIIATTRRRSTFADDSNKRRN